MDDIEAKYLEYLKHLAGTTTTPVVIGRYSVAVLGYIQKGYGLSCKEYLRFRREVIIPNITTTDSTTQIEAVSDFLRYCKTGISRKRVRRAKTLEKLSTIASGNQKRINDYCAALLDGTNLSPNAIRSYMFTIRDFFEYSDEFNKENLRNYINTLEQSGKKPATISLRIGALNRYAEWIKRFDLKMKRPRIQKNLHLENIPTEKEYNQICDYLLHSDPVRYLWIRIIAGTGARRSEFMQFTWEDILSGSIELKGKGGKYRMFFFSRKLQDEVKEYVSRYGLSGHVFMTNRPPYKVISEGGIKEWMNRIALTLGIDKRKLHPHAFRHFFAKMYLKNSKDVIQLSELLGHENLDTTRIYLKKSLHEQERDFNRHVTW